MDRPSVLIIEPDATRRRELGRRLAELGYEVVPAMDITEGLRFAEGLGPAVIVADAELPELGDGEALERLGRSQRLDTLVLLGAPRGRELELPEEVLFLPAAGEINDAVVGRLALVLLGREIGIDADSRLEALVGDLAITPPLEVIRALGGAAFTGRFVVEDGEVVFERGRVVAASIGKVRGVKAFCRLGRLLDGVFRVWLGRVALEGGGREIDEEVDPLVLRAVEDASIGEFPHPRTRLRVEMGPAFFSSDFSPRQQKILSAAHKGVTAGTLFDAFPETDGELLEDLLSLEERGVLVRQQPEAQVRIVTDSTCDLPHDFTRRLGIEVVPLAILFGQRRFIDGRELKPRRFYEMLEQEEVHPATEPPTPEELYRVYERILERQDVVSLHISSKLSLTFSHAESAAVACLAEQPARRDSGEVPELQVLDTRQVSLALGMLAVFAARMALRGQSASAIVERCQSIAGRFQILFVVNTLEFLARGGRIGKAQALLGGLLRIKPILGVADGEVVPVDRVRGGRAAHPRILELLRQRLDPAQPVVAGIAHAKAPVWADRLERLLRDSFEVRELIQTEIGPVVGTHAGPGTVGTVVFQPTAEELELIAPVG